MTNLIGLHIDSTPETLHNQIEKYKDKCGIIQLFVSKAKKYNKNYEDLKKLIIKYKLKVSVHISYIINLSKDSTKFTWWIYQMVDEIKLAEYIGAFVVVVHLGKQLDLPIDIALNNMYINLAKVVSLLNNNKIKILLETSTGQGSETLYKLEDLATFYKNLKINPLFKEKIGICLDTCHIFNAGYDISDKKKIKKYLDDFERLIGINEIKLIHLNDSKNKLGSKLDRHANINYGYIGKDGLIEITRFFTKLGVSLVLETPDDHIDEDLALLNIAMK
jgi:deoxyribonuclease-4